MWGINGIEPIMAYRQDAVATANVVKKVGGGGGGGVAGRLGCFHNFRLHSATHKVSCDAMGGL